MSITKVLRLSACFCLLFVSPLVLAQDESEENENTEPSGNVCISIRTINGFNPIDKEFMHVTASGRKHYLFTMERSCIGLRNANAIAIADAMTRVCSNSMSRIGYRDMGRRNTCRILDIEEVASSEDARALAEAHKEERKDKD